MWFICEDVRICGCHVDAEKTGNAEHETGFSSFSLSDHRTCFVLIFFSRFDSIAPFS